MTAISILVLAGVLVLQTPAAVSRPPESAPAQTGAFEALEREWRESARAWKEELKLAKRAGKKRDEWPADPTPLAWPRFERLADEGEGRAVVWMAQNLKDVFSLKARDDEARELFARVERAGDAPWVADVLEPLDRLRSELGPELDALLERLAARERPAGVRVAALLVLADRAKSDDPRKLELQSEAAALAAENELASADAALAGFLGTAAQAAARADSPRRARALELLRERARALAGTDAAEDVERLLARVERLAIGLVAPDFDAVDVEGNAFKLSDYKGKVTVVDFWGFW